MAQTLSTELAGINSLPVVKPAATVVGGRIKRFRASVTLASQVLGAGNEIVLAKVPAGYSFVFGLVTSSVTLGTSTISVGIPGGTVNEFRAAAAFTAVDTPTPFGTATQIANAPYAAELTILLQTLVANLPAAGTLVVDLFFSSPN